MSLYLEYEQFKTYIKNVDEKISKEAIANYNQFTERLLLISNAKLTKALHIILFLVIIYQFITLFQLWNLNLLIAVLLLSTGYLFKTDHSKNINITNIILTISLVVVSALATLYFSYCTRLIFILITIFSVSIYTTIPNLLISSASLLLVESITENLDYK